VATPVLKILEEKRGVCQDFAHLMLSCLRSLGLAARYVSGYLLTKPPPGQARLIGADAADLGGKVDDEVGIRVAVEARHVRLVREVIVLAARDEDLAGTAGTEAFGDGAAEEAGAAGEEDAGAIEFHGSSASIIGFRAQRLDPEMFIFNSCRTPQVAGV
jgi:transglutaminase-like putative cysteine protease